MFHPVRDGCRGGKGLFTWDSIKNGKDKSKYLGNSIMIPHNKNWGDPFWYASAQGKSAAQMSEADMLKAELEEQKRLEAQLMDQYIRTGSIKPSEQVPVVASATVSNGNQASLSEPPKEAKKLSEKTYGVELGGSPRRSKHRSDRSRSRDRHGKQDRYIGSFAPANSRGHRREEREREPSPRGRRSYKGRSRYYKESRSPSRR